jgi:ABC-type transporter Mla MlaB component
MSRALHLHNHAARKRTRCDEGKGVLSGVPSADVRYGDGVLTIRGMASPPGLFLAGEIAETHFAPLVRALDDFSTSREVHLDLSGLDYCDVACLRAMVCLARPDGADHTAPGVVLLCEEFAPHRLATFGWVMSPRVGEVGDDVESNPVLEFGRVGDATPRFRGAEVGYLDPDAVAQGDESEHGVSLGMQHGVAGQLMGRDDGGVQDRWLHAPTLQDSTRSSPQFP